MHSFSFQRKTLFIVGAVIFIFIAIIMVITNRLFSMSDSSYTDTDFSLRYPRDVSATPMMVAGGGRGVLFHLPQGSVYHLDLAIIPSSITSMGSVSKLFTDVGYEEHAVSVGGEPAKEFRGVLIVSDEARQQTATIVEHKGQIYKLQLSYKGSERNAHVEAIYAQILSTLRFN